MKKIFLFIFVALLAANMGAQESVHNKMSFVVGGTEDVYNSIRVINHSSQTNFSCRVVYLNEDNTVQFVYGEYFLKGAGDADSHLSFVHRNTRLGIQMMSDFSIDVTFSVEYKDYPIYDAIFIYINDASAGYDDSF